MTIMKRIVEFLKRAFESLERMSTVFAILVGIFTVAAPYVYDKIASPFDYVFAIEKIPNPLRLEREYNTAALSTSVDNIFTSPIDKKRAMEQGLSIIDARMLQRKIEEIDSDQVRVWVINMNRQPLDKVNLVFQGCVGYIQLIADPVAHGFGEDAVSNPDVSANGILYRYGTIRQKSIAFVKAGFKDIANCSVALDARRWDGKVAHGKWVTGDEYYEFESQLNRGRSDFILYTLIGFGIILSALFVWFGVAHKKINQRLGTLESQLAKDATDEASHPVSTHDSSVS